MESVLGFAVGHLLAHDILWLPSIVILYHFTTRSDLRSHLSRRSGCPVGFGCVRGGAWRATRFFGGLLVGLQACRFDLHVGLIVGCFALLITVL